MSRTRVLHFEDVGDQTSERRPAEEGGHEEAAGHGDAVGPARQQEVEQEEDGQGHRAEASWWETARGNRHPVCVVVMVTELRCLTTSGSVHVADVYGV